MDSRLVVARGKVKFEAKEIGDVGTQARRKATEFVFVVCLFVFFRDLGLLIAT